MNHGQLGYESKCLQLGTTRYLVYYFYIIIMIDSIDCNGIKR